MKALEQLLLGIESGDVVLKMSGGIFTDWIERAKKELTDYYDEEKAVNTDVLHHSMDSNIHE